jgi:hypothetical protein
MKSFFYDMFDEWGLKQIGESLGLVKAKPMPRRWVVVRKKDSKAWCGPWVHNGKRFTVNENKFCYFSSEEEAEKRASEEKFNFAWDVFEV